MNRDPVYLDKQEQLYFLRGIESGDRLKRDFLLFLKYKNKNSGVIRSKDGIVAYLQNKLRYRFVPKRNILYFNPREEADGRNQYMTDETLAVVLQALALDVGAFRIRYIQYYSRMVQFIKFIVPYTNDMCMGMPRKYWGSFIKLPKGFK